MARLEDNSLRNFLDSEFANPGSRNSLESGTTPRRRDGAEVVDTPNQNVNPTNDNRGTKPPMMLLDNGELNPLWSERYGTPETAPDRGDITADPEKTEPFFKPIRTKPFGKYSTRRQGGVLRYESTFPTPFTIASVTQPKIVDFWTSDGGQIVYAQFVGTFG